MKLLKPRQIDLIPLEEKAPSLSVCTTFVSEDRQKAGFLVSHAKGNFLCDWHLTIASATAPATTLQGTVNTQTENISEIIRKVIAVHFGDFIAETVIETC